MIKIMNLSEKLEEERKKVEERIREIMKKC
jgi:uncharacterized protein (UPF0335 family)